MTGRVQGVGFRYTARREALRLELGGFAKNLPDGSVEIEIEGTTESLERMLHWLQAGPPGAIVSGIAVRDLEELGEATFTITD